MLGIHWDGTATDGWFGKGKTSAIASIAVFAALIMGIAFGVFAAVSAGGEISVPPTATAPITPIAPTTPSSTPTTVTEPGVAVLTVEELLNQVIANPDRYKEGDVIKLTVVSPPQPYTSTGDFVYDFEPKVQGWHVRYTTRYFSPKVISQNGNIFVLQLKFWMIWPGSKTVELTDESYLEN